MPYANGRKLIACLDCGALITKMHMKRHTSRYHGPKALSCSLCKYFAKSNAELTEHISIKHEEMFNLQCPTCNVTTKSYYSLMRHKKLAHGYLPKQSQIIVCPDCAANIQIRSMKKHRTRFHWLWMTSWGLIYLLWNA